MVRVPLILRHLGWHIRSRSRADCGLCRGNSKSTVSFTDHFWHCHRCNAGGDLYSLVKAVHNCGFPAALRYVAELAGVRLADYASAHAQRELEARRQQRERIDQAADALADLERSLLIECRNSIHKCDKVLDAPGPWDEAQWQRARWTLVLLRDFLLPEYTLVAFGSVAERVRYVLANDGERASICGAMRMSGGTRTDSGHFMELMQ